MKNLGIVRSVWELKPRLCIFCTMFLTCFQVPRPIGAESGNVLVPEVHRSVILVMVNVPVGIA